MTFLEFLPQASANLQLQCNFDGDQAMLRQDLLDEFAKTKLGPSLEADAVAARSDQNSPPSILTARCILQSHRSAFYSLIISESSCLHFHQDFSHNKLYPSFSRQLCRSKSQLTPESTVADAKLVLM